ncbi:MAG: histidine triad nucleotide-binding protein [Ruminococcus sp.]|jgi:histidine triad (HIT) family protein|nr:histidine triad nucleotide-binding protein [Ruminococcus sp.]
MDCLFCSIISGEIPSTKVYEDDEILAFKDINPLASVHVLIIPKKHISGINEITSENAEIVAKIFTKIPEITRILSVNESGYRVVSNCGKDGCQSVNHLHFHILGGEKLSEKMC